MTETIEKEIQETDSKILSILPLKDTIVFPYLIAPLMIQDNDQTRLVDDALMRGSRIAMFLQKDASVENPELDDLHEIGTTGNILKMLRFPDGSVRFLIQGLTRVRIKKIVSREPFLTAEIEEIKEVTGDQVKLEALQRSLMDKLKTLIELVPNLSDEFHVSAFNQDTPGKLADYVASNLNIPVDMKQEVLDEANIYKRMNRIYGILNKEIEVLEISQKIQAKAASELGKSQRDYILREQLKAIKKELGDGDEHSEIEEFEKKIKAVEMPHGALIG